MTQCIHAGDGEHDCVDPTSEVDCRTGCAFCGKPGHGEGDHPLPKDHPDYDAFYDASDEELGEILSRAESPGGRRLFPPGTNLT